LGTGLDRRCQYVPIRWIRELESFDEGFVSGDQADGDQALPDRLVHQLPEAVKLALAEASERREPGGNSGVDMTADVRAGLRSVGVRGIRLADHRIGAPPAVSESEVQVTVVIVGDSVPGS
jgi:hypothetical protein